eukprot:gb/GECG01000036.1/.p1 GENE.gb/GECG01000036.1/~~gb/GECG01000036.1/.p1  ORF type:complete len:221 (+),score=15.62 gb/GECG01000036.1/:1-663(+)
MRHAFRKELQWRAARNKLTWTWPSAVTTIPRLSRPFSTRPLQHQERRLLHFPTWLVYDVITSVDDYKYFVPWCVDSVVTRKDDAYLEAQLAVGFNVFRENYTSAVTLENHDHYKKVIALAKNTQIFHFLQNEWYLQPVVSEQTAHALQKEGRLQKPEDLALCESCWVSLRVEFAFRSSLYAQASSMFLDQVVRRMAEAFAKRCHHRYKRALGRTALPQRM